MTPRLVLETEIFIDHGLGVNGLAYYPFPYFEDPKWLPGRLSVDMEGEMVLVRIKDGG